MESVTITRYVNWVSSRRYASYGTIRDAILSAKKLAAKENASVTVTKEDTIIIHQVTIRPNGSSKQ